MPRSPWWWPSARRPTSSATERRGRRLVVAHVLIIHEVADYAAWKAVFDDAAGLRRDAGERAYRAPRFVYLEELEAGAL